MPDRQTQTTDEALHHARVEIVRLRGELEAMKQSASWRLTRPLRRIKRLAERTTARGTS